MSKRRVSGEAEGSKKSKRQVCSTQPTLHKYFVSENSGNGDSMKSTVAPQTPQSYGIHIYTPQEVDEAKGLEKDYRRFWNEKAAEICQDKSSRLMLGDKVAIQGAINTSWIQAF